LLASKNGSWTSRMVQVGPRAARNKTNVPASWVDFVALATCGELVAVSMSSTFIYTAAVLGNRPLVTLFKGLYLSYPLRVSASEEPLPGVVYRRRL
jgi:hypothetical protein